MLHSLLGHSLRALHLGGEMEAEHSWLVQRVTCRAQRGCDCALATEGPMGDQHSCWSRCSTFRAAPFSTSEPEAAPTDLGQVVQPPEHGWQAHVRCRS